MIKIRFDRTIESVIFTRDTPKTISVVKDGDGTLIGDVFNVINQFVGMATAIEFIEGEVILISKGMFDNAISNALMTQLL